MTIRAVHHLNCGSMCPIGGWLFGTRGLRADIVAHCLLLETARDGLVLVDTGFGTRDLDGASGFPVRSRAFIGARFDPDETAIAQVRALGFSPRDVRHIAVTHLDLDHAGGLTDFPDATVHVHAREHAAAVAPPTVRERQRYLRGQFGGVRWALYQEHGDTWRGLPAIARLTGVDADIGIVPLHGHTRGHSAVIARAGERWLVHAGDAYFHRARISGDGRVPLGFRAIEHAMAVDNNARRDSAEALARLARDHADVDVFCAHDARELARYHS